MLRNAVPGVDRLSCGDNSGANCQRFALSAASAFFKGHFDDAPIFPGVAHLALAIAAYTGVPPNGRILQGVRDVRFVRPLVPGDEVAVSLTAGPTVQSARFEIHCAGELASSGVLLFQPDNDVPG